ncbi:helix-turn-helix transcriptional regulator [Dactylosporangium sp. NPDC000244]|uniref:helix-turn-helix domain-containing protein n=1 Tax=Dactylosporangium sp. NPDC000244 TaxID=3154365 RepID=UPI0033204F9B
MTIDLVTKGIRAGMSPAAAAIQDQIDEHLRALADLFRIVDWRRQSGESLTDQQLHVCTLAAAGLSNREIAARMFLSEDTVKTHLRLSYSVLGIRRRSQLVWALAGKGGAV